MPHRLLISGLALTIGLGLSVCVALDARAGSTGPVVAIGEIHAMPAGAASVLEVVGIVGFDDALQIDYPLGLVVYQGEQFVHYQLGRAPESGTSTALADGLQIADLTAIDAAGAADADAEVLELEPRKVLVALPSSIRNGIVRVGLYISLPGEPTVMSNIVSTTLSGVEVGP